MAFDLIENASPLPVNFPSWPSTARILGWMISLCLRSLIGSRGLIPETLTASPSLDLANRRRNRLQRNAKKRSGAALLVIPFHSQFLVLEVVYNCTLLSDGICFPFSKVHIDLSEMQRTGRSYDAIIWIFLYQIQRRTNAIVIQQ
jgi:hypothetical protein